MVCLRAVYLIFGFLITLFNFLKLFNLLHFVNVGLPSCPMYDCDQYNKIFYHFIQIILMGREKIYCNKKTKTIASMNIRTILETQMGKPTSTDDLLALKI